MRTKLLITLFVAACGLIALMFLSGCGDDKKVEQPALPDIASTNAEADLNAKIEELKKKEMTVELVTDGQSQGKWSQDGKGSWRLDDPTTKGYTIYNADLKKGWSVDGNTATELDASSMQMYELSSPLVILSAYSSFANLPRSGGSDDVWEWNIPGLGSLKIEFKGPDGLMSKISSDGGGVTGESSSTTIELKYSNVGNVPDSMFKLPSDVTVTSTTGSGLGTSTGSDFGGSVSVPSESGY